MNKLGIDKHSSLFRHSSLGEEKNVSVKMKPGCQVFRGGKYPIGNISQL
jgi:hypothetical protein